MHDLAYYLMVLVLGGLFAWRLRSGSAGWVWWDGRRNIYRDRDPFSYWVLMIIQFAVFIYFVVKGKRMPW
ncbi:MAG: hypothetical protein ACJ796_02380 [Gemmatimonadaceae bacterium]